MIAVIIPLYKQSQYLLDAVLSALNQHACTPLVVIVNDGCPEDDSDRLSRCLRNTYPERIVYLKKSNGGLSSARNTGIKYVLRNHPEIRFFLFLDADNVLGNNFFNISLKLLAENTCASWIYFPLRTFGFKVLNWNFATPFNVYRQFFENQCDAGSIVRRELFEHGILFDESLRSGYEDWEFFLRAGLRGFYGIREDKADFLYRTKRESMVTDAERKHEKLLNDIHALHRNALEPKSLLVTEHNHCPRFLLIDAEVANCAILSDPDRIVWRSGDLKQVEPPPLLFFSSKRHVTALTEAKLLRPFMFLVQEAAAHNFVGCGPLANGARFSFGEERGSDFILWGGEYRAVREYLANGRNIFELAAQSRRFVCEIPYQFSKTLTEPISLELDKSFIDGITLISCGSKLIRKENIDQFQGTIEYFSWKKHIEKLQTSYPVCTGRQTLIAFFVPWLRLGGVDLCVVNIVKQLKLIDQNLRVHLVLTQENIVEVPPNEYTFFDEIIPLAHVPWERRLKLCEVIAESMDLAIIAHSAAAYEALSMRQAKPANRRFGRVVSYLHVIDQDKYGRLVGYPYDAAQHDAALDGHVVISEQLRQFLLNVGVSRERIRVARNAPVVYPVCRQQAIVLAETKAAMLCSKPRALQVLFAGRLDYQKGLPRLIEVMHQTENNGIEVQFTLVGSSLLANEEISLDFPHDHCRLLPATNDQSLLHKYYTDADAFLLLSRWEGMPLAILDAMAHGAVVIATDVGAVAEIVTDGQNGFLIDEQDDDQIVMDTIKALKHIISDPSGCVEIRRNAVATAFSKSWRDAAEVFIDLIR